MPDREKVFDALRNCITEPKCKDCPWETCEEFHQTKTLPLDLCLDILKLLKEQETKAGTWQWKIHGKAESGGTLGEAVCDQCMKSTYATAVKGDLNYCPNCGAKMKQEGRRK